MKMMQKNLNSVLLGAFILLLSLFGLPPAQAATLTSIDVTPSNPTIDVGQTLAFTATGTFSDGSTQVLGVSATAIAAGFQHSCALLSDSTVQCWGYNSYGQLGNGTTADSATPVTVSGISTATAIAAGRYDYSCALLASGAVQCWGWNGSGQLGNGTTTDSSTPVTVSGISTATAIAAGGAHACALLAGGAVQCWGENGIGQLGNGTTVFKSTTPVMVSGINTATAIAAGVDLSCALLADGTVHCWGSNNYGELGNGMGGFSTTPVTVSGISTATAIAAGRGDICALLSNGTVQCWGSNYYGELGNGTNTDSIIPVTVSGISTATAIAAGYNHSCALLAGGAVQCWGGNSAGQLGSGTTTDSSTPVTVTGMSSATAIAAGGAHSCAVLADGGVLCWGYNSYGQLGNGTIGFSNTPVTVSNIINATAIAAGGTHSCALLDTGAVQCLGDNRYGQLGNGSTTDSTTPVTVSGITSATAIAAGANYSCALLSNGTIQCWGINNYGQLGDGTTTQSTIPVSVSGITSATAIAVGGGHSCALLATRAVQCWGYNLYGQLGNGAINIMPSGITTPVMVSGITNATAIATGGAHTCALLATGTVQCWGYNSWGELGNGTTTQSTIPVSVSGITNATAISAAGGDHTCALLAAGTVQCWGYNLDGELGNGSTADSIIPVTVSGITNATAIAAGYLHSCALLAGGAVQCWGDNSDGELGNGSSVQSAIPVTVSGITTATAIAAIYKHSCVLLASGAVQCWGWNGYGQVGKDTIADSTIPVTVSGIAGSGNVVWSSSDPSVATINATGLATAVVSGTATITATAGNISGNTVLTVASSSSPKHTLSMIATGTGSGTVSGGGTYSASSTATVSATADVGSTFTGWVDPNAAECATGSVLMDADKICTANFTINTYTLSLGTTGIGSGTVNGGGSYNYGQTAIVTQLANAGSTFAGWGGPDGAECGTGFVIMNANKSCTATFTLNTLINYTLTLGTSGTGSGTVSGNGTYNSGQTAKVMATADAGSTFTGWSGTNAAECATGSVLMDADKACTANFTLGAEVGPQLSISPTSIYFAYQFMNQSANIAPSTVTVTNDGQIDITFDAVSLSNQADFQLISADGECRNSVLSPGQSCVIAIAFSPTTVGPISGQLNILISANGSISNKSVSLTGVGADYNAADWDGDGLSNDYELNTYYDATNTLRTDPLDPDTDGDGIPDGWEVNGRDVNGVHLDLHAMGANPLHRDIFVQIDYMECKNYRNPLQLFGFKEYCDSDERDSKAHTHKPKAAAIDTIVKSFNDAPVQNLDGKSGVSLHVDFGKDTPMHLDPKVTWDKLSKSTVLDHSAYIGTTVNCKTDSSNSLCANFKLPASCSDGSNPKACIKYDWSAFNRLKSKGLSPERKEVFHYVVFAHELGGEYAGVSGLSAIDGADVIVSLGTFAAMVGSRNDQAGTFMHELGHNLGLNHGGGTDDGINHKPNYLSVMNYTFQFSGLIKNYKGGYFDYSRFALPPLNENSLNEFLGLYGGNADALSYLKNNGDYYVTSYYCPSDIPDSSLRSWQFFEDARGPFNWDCNFDASGNADTSGIGISASINDSPQDVISGIYNKTFNLKEDLKGHSDWGNLNYAGVASGSTSGMGAAISEVADPIEITSDEALQQRHLYAVTVESPSSSAGLPGSTVHFEFNVKNNGENTDIYKVTLSSPEGWVISNSVSSQLSLAPAVSALIAVDVEIPASAAEGDHNEISLMVVSENNPNIGDSGAAVVAVPDTTAPNVMAPTNILVPATSAAGAVVTYPACTATDNLDPTPSMSYSQPSDTTFPVGTTIVLCTAMDSAGNNSTASFTVTVQDTTGPVLPDLIVNKVSTGILNIKRNAGGNFNVSDTVENLGGSQAGKFIVAYHLSTDVIYGNGDDVVSATTRKVIYLDPGASNTWNPTNVVIPTTAPPGIYHLCAKADDDVDGIYAVTESNEDNNWACTATTTEVPKPDLYISQVSIFTYSMNAGGTMTVLDSLTNKGGSQALAFDVGYVLSPNSVIGDGDDIPVGSRTVTSVGVGATSTASASVIIPASVPPGSYYVGAIADTIGAVDELNEANNTKRASSKVTINP